MSVADSVTTTRLRQKPLPVGITAGAEDAKYQAKYKELKRKVKDIEVDNDKLHFKVLQAKLSIRRMKMERAILYERLSTVPPSPNLHDRHPLPSIQAAAPGPGGLPPPPHIHPRVIPGVPQVQHRDHPFHPTANLDMDPAHIPSDHIRHHHHHQPPPRMNVNTGLDPRPAPLDNPPAASSPHMLVHSPPNRMPPAHDVASTTHLHHHQQHIPRPYESRGGSHETHVHTSPPPGLGSSHSRNRSLSRSSPRAIHSNSQLHQNQTQSSSHLPLHPIPQSYRGGSGSSNNSNNNHNSGHGPGSGSQQHRQYPEILTPVQQPLHSPPLSEREFERAGGAAARVHHSHHPHHQHTSHSQHGSSSSGHQHSQHSHHHHILHHHHHSHPHQQQQAQAQAQAQNEYGDPSESAPPAIQPQGTGYESGGGRGTVDVGPPASETSGRIHAHPRERVAYEYPPHHEGKRERDRETGRERERDREKDRDNDPDREWERERDRAREYSRGELINYSPPHHRTRSTQSQSQSRPLSRTHSQSHLAPAVRSQSQAANPSGEYEHTSSSRSHAAPSSGVPPPPPPTGSHTPQPQYHPGSEDPPVYAAQPYREYPPAQESTTTTSSMYTPRLAPSSRAGTPLLAISGTGSGSIIGHGGVAGPEGNTTGSRDREREAQIQKDRGRQQQAPGGGGGGGGGGSGAGGNSEHHHHGKVVMDSGRKRSRNEMEMDGEYEVKNNDGDEGSRGMGTPNSGMGGGRQISHQTQESDSRTSKRYHRQADSSPERERR